ncbi:phytoene desaturase family protein [Micrococcus sp. TA1]|uniref:phytoene desaturase family protein n=1 Tax=Micrococcus sp. TA1 TaxID=681627 RepID=UPI00161FD27F|nr:phytoene desaturase family protein [Micrococcus sp. TA1]MBB5749867.1 phytoene desaturase [Micrococcus sp. TA1]
MSERVVVIGGGISGLASAALLARDGYSVDLVEAREDFGGRAGSWERDGFRFDTGPSWYLMPEVFDHFFRLLGTSAAAELDLQQLDPGYRVFFEGESRPLDIAADRQANVELFEQVEPGAGRALERYLDSAQRTYDMAIGRFLYTSFTSYRPFLDRDLLTQLHRLGPLLLESLERFTGRHFTDHRLRQVLGYPAVFLGSSPDRTPSMYHLMSALDLTGGVLYPQGGFTGLIDVMVRLARESGVRLHAATPATAILTEPAGTGRRGNRGVRDLVSGARARATGVRVRGRDGAERVLPADVVVSAADLHHTETTLLPQGLQTYPEAYWRKRTSGPGAVLVMLGVRGDLPQLPHHSLFFTRDWDANFGAIRAGDVPDPASVYVCRPSATDPHVAPAGHENLFVLVPMPADPGLGGGGPDGGGDRAVEAIADAAIDQVARWADVPDLAERVVVRRTVGPADFARDLGAWRGGMLGPAHTLAQSAMFRTGNVSRRVRSLYYAGSSTIPGIGLPMCLISAEILLKRLRGDHSASPLAAPLLPTIGGPTPSGPVPAAGPAPVGTGDSWR